MLSTVNFQEISFLHNYPISVDILVYFLPFFLLVISSLCHFVLSDIANNVEEISFEMFRSGAK